LVIVVVLDLLFGLVLVLIEILVEVLLFALVSDAVLVEVFVLILIEVLVEVLLFDLVLDEVLVEVGAGGAWIELTGLLLLVEGKADADWKRSSSELLDKLGRSLGLSSSSSVSVSFFKLSLGKSLATILCLPACTV